MNAALSDFIMREYWPALTLYTLAILGGLIAMAVTGKWRGNG